MVGAGAGSAMRARGAVLPWSAMRLCLPLLLLIGCDDVAPVVCRDSAEPTAFYRDDDGDGFGLAERVRFACEAPVGFVSAPGDCRDDDPASFPGAPEQCDWWDNDCNGVIDDDVAEPTVWYADADGDGYGDPGNTTGACDVPAGFVADFSDCSDADAEIHPGADEYCDDVDQDCDGAPDDAESVDAPLWHEDADGDGFGDRFAGRRRAPTRAGCWRMPRIATTPTPTSTPEPPSFVTRPTAIVTGTQPPTRPTRSPGTQTPIWTAMEPGAPPQRPAPNLLDIRR